MDPEHWFQVCWPRSRQHPNPSLLLLAKIPLAATSPASTTSPEKSRPRTKGNSVPNCPPTKTEMDKFFYMGTFTITFRETKNYNFLFFSSSQNIFLLFPYSIICLCLIKPVDKLQNVTTMNLSEFCVNVGTIRCILLLSHSKLKNKILAGCYLMKNKLGKLRYRAL